eukprot:8317988-Alexandrium_andersonii.AAC.1
MRERGPQQVMGEARTPRDRLRRALGVTRALYENRPRRALGFARSAGRDPSAAGEPAARRTGRGP